jgi:hypothetical protein
MQRKNTLLASVSTLIFAFSLTAGAQTPAKVAGIWDITMGTVVRTLTLQQDGSKITGSIKGPAGVFALEDGVINGNKISFSADLTVQGRKVHRDYAGTVDGDSITGTVKDGAQTSTFTAKPGPDRSYDPPPPAKP